MIRTACGLDCPDACGIISNENIFPKVQADTTHPTSNGALCSLINHHIHTENRIEKPMVNGEEVSMQEALDEVAKALEVDKKLLWRGSGNFGVMQEVTNLLFKEINGTTTKGSLCDGSGDAGILAGRGVNRLLPPSEIEKSEGYSWCGGKNVTGLPGFPYFLAYFLREGKFIVDLGPLFKNRVFGHRRGRVFFSRVKPEMGFYLWDLFGQIVIFPAKLGGRIFRGGGGINLVFCVFTQGLCVPLWGRREKTTPTIWGAILKRLF